MSLRINMFGVVYYGALFIFGLAVGSFLNVVSLRYDPEKFLFHREIIGGRSRCPYCRNKLKWFELVPVLSFAAQGGRCRHCHGTLSFQYPIVEVLSGLLFVFVPWRLTTYHLPPATYYSLSALWIIAFSVLLLATLVDSRLRLIPDEANIFLLALGILNFLALGGAQFSFLSPYGQFLGSPPFWLGGLLGALIGAVFFWFLVWVTRGRGMGWGDLKFAAALGLLFGWPDTVLIIILAFVSGAVFGLAAIVWGRKRMKSLIAFGPFLALASAAVFFWGADLVKFYLSLIGL